MDKNNFFIIIIFFGGGKIQTYYAVDETLVVHKQKVLKLADSMLEVQVGRKEGSARSSEVITVRFGVGGVGWGGVGGGGGEWEDESLGKCFLYPP